MRHCDNLFSLPRQPSRRLSGAFRWCDAAATALIIVAMAALSGCGQKGPLYVPDETPQQQDASLQEETEKKKSANAE